MLRIEKKTVSIEVLTTRSGMPYIGCSIDEYLIEPYLQELREHTNRKYNILRNNQIERDLDEFHITLLSPREFSKLSKIFRKRILQYIEQRIEFDFFGLGKTVKNSNVSYFIVLESNKAKDIRTSLGLPTRDFHITLGFDEQDIHNVSKSKATIFAIPNSVKNISREAH